MVWEHAYHLAQQMLVAGEQVIDVHAKLVSGFGCWTWLTVWHPQPEMRRTGGGRSGDGRLEPPVPMISGAPPLAGLMRGSTCALAKTSAGKVGAHGRFHDAREIGVAPRPPREASAHGDATRIDRKAARLVPWNSTAGASWPPITSGVNITRFCTAPDSSEAQASSRSGSVRWSLRGLTIPSATARWYSDQTLYPCACWYGVTWAKLAASSAGSTGTCTCRPCGLRSTRRRLWPNVQVRDQRQYEPSGWPMRGRSPSHLD